MTNKKKVGSHSLQNAISNLSVRGNCASGRASRIWSQETQSSPYIFFNKTTGGSKKSVCARGYLAI